jgi:hypothetical protein
VRVAVDLTATCGEETPGHLAGAFLALPPDSLAGADEAGVSGERCNWPSG